MPPPFPPLPRLKATQWAASILAWGLVAAAATAHAQSSIDLAQATLEDLLNTEVTSASKKEQHLFGTAAAIYVLTHEDLRRSGATTIPEALRLVPGLQVATIDANKWAVSARGANGLWSNKLLVLMDGRVVYSPVSSGVYWDLQEVILEDVDRIEVVRGPGASVWGANAVNGVINIISKPADRTRGGVVSIAAGSTANGVGAFRYGGRAGTRGAYRVFVKHADRGAFADERGEAAGDGSRMTHGGFRFDFAQNDRTTWTLQAGALSGESGQRVGAHLTSYIPVPRATVTAESPATAGHVVARWTRTPSPDSQLSLQAFWDRSYRMVVGKGETTQTLDLEFQHRFKAGRRHDVVWGAGQRFWSDRIEEVFGEYFDPSSSRMRLFNVFVQDEITMPAAAVHVTVGTKVEHNSSAGVEVQPTARLAWQPTHRHTLWAAASRAARTPSRIERALHVDYAAFSGANGQLVVLGIRGNPDMRTEHTTAFEAGYRVNPGADLSFEVASFYNVYRDLKTENSKTSFEVAPGPPHVLLYRQYVSGMRGESVGAEFLVRWRPSPLWNLEAGYDRLHTRLYNRGTTPEATILSDRNPSYQARLRSQLNLPSSWQADATWLYVSALDGVKVPAYARLDLRIGGAIAPGLDLSLAGQNLLTPLHREFDGFEGVHFSQVPRSWIVRATWSF